VYITRSVPVTPGHRYQAEVWIRGEEIAAAVQGEMSPVGATIIVEFARPDGSWFASGDYADSQWDTFDWRRVRTEPVKAPEGAGFAIIYLALRGTGTAWFDDVRMVEVTHHPVLLEPLPEAQVHDNTPVLTWHFPHDARATVELSRDPQFPADATRTLSDVRSPATIEEPIEPATWYWRVAVDEYNADSATWSFEQTAGLDEDTTEPTVARTHDWLATPTAPMRLEYADNTGVAEVSLVVDGEDVSGEVEAGATEATYTPETPWSDGLHVAEVRVEDAAGNAAEETIFFTSGRPDERITWELQGGVSVDGEKRFLLGMYGVDEEYMPEMARAGLDYVHTYRWDGSGDTESALAYLDEAQRHGLQVFMGLDRGRLQAHDERFVAERVAALMRHPGLLAWYLYDEPDLEHQYVSPEWLERYYHLIKALDPFHPVIVTCARDSAVPEYRDALDVHWTQVYGDTARVANRLELHRGMLREGTPLAAILHSYDRIQSGLAESGTAPDPAKFQPDGPMMRANAFMAIAHNSSGLTWWWWGYGGSHRYFTVAQAPEAWESLQETIARIQELEPVLTAEGEIATRVLEPVEGVEVHVWEKRLPDRVVTIAVNRDDQAVEASWEPTWALADDTAQVRWEEREVTLEGGEITDSFAPRDVHVYTAANGG
ncbi:MAG: Ig-like domain-containing protein, partial [Armatimonadota bacterium]